MIKDDFLNITFSKEQYEKLIKKEKRTDLILKNIEKVFKLMTKEGLPIMSQDPYIFTKEVQSITVNRGTETQIYLNYET